MVNIKKPLKNQSSQNQLLQSKYLRNQFSDMSQQLPLQVAFNQTLTQYLNTPLLKSASGSQRNLLLALSGGLDSVVLLHLLASARQVNNSNIQFNLSALHVYHGLSLNANSWTHFCTELCESLHVPFAVKHVLVDKNSGLGIEAEARKQRYEALFNFADENEIKPDFILTAHHQDDQAETLLLQLFRGTGVKGLSAMANIDEKRRLLRPLLSVSKAALLEYATQHQLKWCDDESNSDTYYERNFVRHEVLPNLTSRYPAIQTVLARTAGHMAEASALLDDLASIDASIYIKNNALDVKGLRDLSYARAKNLFRMWLANNQLAIPTAQQLDEILSQCLNAKPDANIELEIMLADTHDYLMLKRYQDTVFLCSNIPPVTYDLVWNGEPELILPNGDKLLFSEVHGNGLAKKFGMARLRISNRVGGERFKPDALRPTRTLKHLLQAVNMPPWQREHLPLIYWQDTLACVPNVGYAHELKAKEAEVGIQITWCSNAQLPKASF